LEKLIIPKTNKYVQQTVDSARKNIRRNKSSQSAQNAISLDLYNHGTTAASGDRDFVTDDMRQPKRSFLYRETPPRNFRFRPFWCQTQLTYNQTIQPGPSTNENNITFSLSNSNAPNLDFDQYTIDRVMVTFSTRTAASASGTYGDLYTALDYDNSNLIGSVAAMQAYSTIKQHLQNPTKALTREVFPQVSSAIYNNGVTFGYSPMRLWVDASNTTVPFYGLRSMVANASFVYTMEITLTFILAFRNTI